MTRLDSVIEEARNVRERASIHGVADGYDWQNVAKRQAEMIERMGATIGALLGVEPSIKTALYKRGWVMMSVQCAFCKVELHGSKEDTSRPPGIRIVDEVHNNHADDCPWFVAHERWMEK